MDWIDKLLSDREAKTGEQAESRWKERIRRGDAPMKVMKDLEAHATAAIDEFNRKNHDQELGAFRCEARSDDAFAIVRELDSRHCGQVVVSLNGAKGSVFVLYQPGGLEQQDTFDLQAQPDGDLYIFHGGHRMNVDEITERIVSRFILALEH